MESYLALIKNNWAHAICDKMDGPGKDNYKGNKSEGEKQRVDHFT